MYGYGDGHIPLQMATIRGCRGEEHTERHTCSDHSAAHRCHCRYLDGQRNHTHAHLLRLEDSPPLNLPACIVHYLCRHITPHRFIVDNHRHHRRCADGYRPCVGLRRWMDCGCDYLGSILWRQGLNDERHYRAGVIYGRSTSVQAYSVYDGDNCPLAAHCAGGIYHSRLHGLTRLGSRHADD